MNEQLEIHNAAKRVPKQVGHLHRKLFLLVFGIMLLGQILLLVDKGLSTYYQLLERSFKVVLTIDSAADQAQLATWGHALTQQAHITSVHLFSPEDALAVVRHKNPQLVDSLLLMGKNQMPAFFEITLAPAAISNIRPFVDNLQVQYKGLVAHYNAEQAQQLFYVGMCNKLLRGLCAGALLAFLAFMFLVEAAPYKHPHWLSGLLSGLLAALVATGVVAVALYPIGLFKEFLTLFVVPWRQVSLWVSGCLLGWTLSKWQRF